MIKIVDVTYKDFRFTISGELTEALPSCHMPESFIIHKVYYDNKDISKVFRALFSLEDRDAIRELAKTEAKKSI